MEIGRLGAREVFYRYCYSRKPMYLSSGAIITGSWLRPHVYVEIVQWTKETYTTNAEAVVVYSMTLEEWQQLTVEEKEKYLSTSEFRNSYSRETSTFGNNLIENLVRLTRGEKEWM